jgi:hypothetical protein
MTLLLKLVIARYRSGMYTGMMYNLYCSKWVFVIIVGKVSPVFRTTSSIKEPYSKSRQLQRESKSSGPETSVALYVSPSHLTKHWV